MVRPKNLQHSPTLAQMLEDTRSSLGKVVDSRWYVEEYTPGYETFGYYHVYVNPTRRRVSEYFDNPHDAEVWKGAHEPEEGSLLFIRRENLYERTERQWL